MYVHLPSVNGIIAPVASTCFSPDSEMLLSMQTDQEIKMLQNVVCFHCTIHTKGKYTKMLPEIALVHLTTKTKESKTPNYIFSMYNAK
jgi:hypothetical protein